MNFVSGITVALLALFSITACTTPSGMSDREAKQLTHILKEKYR